ncbi:MAG: GTP-binding protein [Candidatus Lokiarchaeota archaeon]|jgi:small GTP-binding protein|nr:GTP-binding protein [Candidatus Lokiarchaeota archaeon]
MSGKPIVLKVLTAGEGGVGKTTLLHRYVEGKFEANTKMTIGVEFFLKEVNIEGKNIMLQLWDFGGQERFRFLLKSYTSGAKGALLMFDLTRPLTLDRIGQWIEICRSDNDQLPILFLGTKNDLKDEISVNEEYVEELMEQYDLIDYLKISSKTGENVRKSFEILTINILEELGKL